MPIDVTILEFPQGSSLTESSMTFDEQGGTLGRAQDNTWVLDDPDRFLSGCHSQITFENGHYFLLDTSTNGTFVNNSSEPLGKGNRVQLNDGDNFELSEYKFQVRIIGGASAIPPASVPNNLDVDDPFGPATVNPLPYTPPVSTPPNPFDQQDPFGSSAPASAMPITGDIAETDPLAALDRSSNSFEQVQPQSDPFASNSYSDSSGAINQAVSWPSAGQQGGIIPQDWDDEDLMASEPDAPPAVAPQQPVQQQPVQQQQVAPQIETPVNFEQAKIPESWEDEPQAHVLPSTPASPQVKPATVSPERDLRAQTPTPRKKPQTDRSKQSISVSESEARRKALEQANRKLKAEILNLKKQQAALKRRSSSGVDTAVVEGIGFKVQDLSDDKISEINELSGEFIRYSIEGLMQTLSSRNNVKNTFRMNMTTIQPVENNPLKFSANVDDAIENMFIKRGNSYKKPIETIQESFESIADHQVAILAGIRSAFKGIVARFEPKTLESRFEKQNKRGLIPRNEKAKNWEAFNAYYEELFSDIDGSFQYLFGEEFSQAYEEQLQKLSFARKEQNKSSKLRDK